MVIMELGMWINKLIFKLYLIIIMTQGNDCGADSLY